MLNAREVHSSILLFGGVFISLVSQESKPDPWWSCCSPSDRSCGAGAVHDFTSYFDVLAPESSQNFARPQVGVWLNLDFFLP